MTFTAQDARSITDNTKNCSTPELKAEYDNIIEQIKIIAVRSNTLVLDHINKHVRAKLDSAHFSVYETRCGYSGRKSYTISW